MSKRYEFLSPGAELVEGDDLLDLGEDEIDQTFALAGGVTLVLGNPWATAAVLVGTRESISEQLRGYLAVVTPPSGAARGFDSDGRWHG